MRERKQAKINREVRAYLTFRKISTNKKKLNGTVAFWWGWDSYLVFITELMNTNRKLLKGLKRSGFFFEGRIPSPKKKQKESKVDSGLVKLTCTVLTINEKTTN